MHFCALFVTCPPTDPPRADPPRADRQAGIGSVALQYDRQDIFWPAQPAKLSNCKLWADCVCSRAGTVTLPRQPVPASQLAGARCLDPVPGGSATPELACATDIFAQRGFTFRESKPHRPAQGPR